MSPLLSYQEVKAEIGLGRRGRTHLLLGNGFSIACDPRYDYRNLYNLASVAYSEEIRRLFAIAGTNNFEGVLRILDNSIEVIVSYGFEEILEFLVADRETIKESLIGSLVATHMTDTGELPDQMKKSCGNFLRPYYNVFTTNYDLLLYWVQMSNADLQPNDGFRNDDLVDDADYVVFKERAGDNKSIFFLHGALHFFRVNGQLRKHTWCRTGTPLIPGVRNGLGLGQYPLFVAEGSSEKKLQQILSDSYLDYCLGKLGRIQNALVVFGLSFGNSDDHILCAIKDNYRLSSVYVGLYGAEHLEQNIQTCAKLTAIGMARNATEHPLAIKFFDSESAHVWDAI